jgi:hypothetical protein
MKPSPFVRGISTDLAGLAGFWRDIFTESPEINENFRILNEIQENS